MYLWKEANGPPAAAGCLYVAHSDKNRAQSAASVYFTDINMKRCFLLSPVERQHLFYFVLDEILDRL